MEKASKYLVDRLVVEVDCTEPINPVTMSSNVVVCTIDQDLKDELKKFRYSKAKEGTAIIMKVCGENI